MWITVLILSSVVVTASEVNIDSVTTNGADASAFSFSHTTHTSNGLLVLTVATDAGQRVSGTPTYNGTQTFTLLGNVTHTGTRPTVEVWFLTDPEIGTNTVAFTLFSSDKTLASVVSYNNVDQTTPISDFITSQGTDTNPTVSISTTTSQLLVDGMASLAAQNLGITEGAGQTQIYNAEMVTSGHNHSGSTKDTTGSTSMSWTLGESQAWVIAAYNINEDVRQGVYDDFNDEDFNLSKWGNRTAAGANAQLLQLDEIDGTFTMGGGVNQNFPSTRGTTINTTAQSFGPQDVTTVLIESEFTDSFGQCGFTNYEIRLGNAQLYKCEWEKPGTGEVFNYKDDCDGFGSVSSPTPPPPLNQSSINFTYLNLTHVNVSFLNNFNLQTRIVDVSGRLNDELEITTRLAGTSCSGGFNTWGGNVQVHDVSFIGQGIQPIVVANNIPPDNTQFNALSLNFTADVTSDLSNFNCTFNFDGTANQSVTNVTAGVDVPISFTVGFSPTEEAKHSYSFLCVNEFGSDQTDNFTFFVDNVDPQIITDFVNLTVLLTPLTAQFNFSDTFLLHSYNISVDGTTIDSQIGLNVTFISVNISEDVSGFPGSVHNLTARVADGHTAKELRGKYKWSNGLWNDHMQYNFDGVYKKGWLQIRNKKSSIWDYWTSTEKKDRHNFKFIPSKQDQEYYTFVVTAESKLFIVDAPNTPWKKWIIYDDHWIDFYIKDFGNLETTIKRISDTEAEVTVKNPHYKTGKETEFEFESIGDLNIVTTTFTFFTAEFISTFNGVVFSGTSETYGLRVEFQDVVTNLTPTALLEFNGTNFTSTLVLLNTSTAIFTQDITIPEVPNKELANHTWIFNFGLADKLVGPNTQTIYNFTVGTCAAPVNNTLITLNYFDEQSNQPINVSNGFNLNINATDNLISANTKGVFIGNTTNNICTNIEPNVINKTFGVSGSYTLEAPGFVSRIFLVDPTVPDSAANNNPLNKSLFLINFFNSSTVKYTWQSDNLVLVNGVMKIFRCNLDGTRDVVESVPVIDGQATANIELFTQAYAYDITTGGVTFTNGGWNQCHVEISTAVTYIVEIGVPQLEIPIGLVNTLCKLVKLDNNTVSMTWTLNPQSSLPLEGCILAFEQSLKGYEKVLETCTTNATTISSIVPLNDLSIIANGELRQGGISVVCNNDIAFHKVPPGSQEFGATGLFAVFLLVAAFVLFYTGDGKIQIIAASAALLLSFVLGIIAFPIITILAIIGLGIIVILVGRNDER